jgi:SAM-dependent methyltransferase
MSQPDAIATNDCHGVGGDPAGYEAWYDSPRGRWMGEREAAALLRLGGLREGMSVLDAGCGSGFFTRHFAAVGAAVVGLDRDSGMLAYARQRDARPPYVQGDLLALPFADRSFDVAAAVTSLCFVADERRALGELIRVARRAVVLGLLHRHSLLYLLKRGRGGYAGARWHTRDEIERLARGFPAVQAVIVESLLFWPGGAGLGRLLERMPGLSDFGAFMAVKIELKVF